MIVALVIGLIVAAIIIGVISDQNKKKEREREALERAERIEKRMRDLVEKYGEDLGAKIFKQEFFLGMTKEQLIDSKGCRPDKVENEVLKTKTKETWIYGNKNSGDVFVFENEVLTKFKDR